MFRCRCWRRTIICIKRWRPSPTCARQRPDTPDPIAVLLDQHPAVMILADVGTLSDTDYARLTQFVDDGGLLLRFAGTRLAAASDGLVPVRLRRGGRVLGGALVVGDAEAARAVRYAESVRRLHGAKRRDRAPPGSRRARCRRAGKDLGASRGRHAARDRSHDGKGMIVLFHVTADTTWSNLPISGLFVDMLRKIVDLSTVLTKPDAITTSNEKVRKCAADEHPRRLRRARGAAADSKAGAGQFRRRGDR